MALKIPKTRLLGPEGTPIDAPKYDFSRGIPNIEVVGPWLLVLNPVRGDRVTEQGIILPERAQETASEGLVMLTGDPRIMPNGERIPPRVEPGWEIIYARYAGIEMNLHGASYVLIQESEIRVVLSYAGRYFTPKPDLKPEPEPEMSPETYDSEPN